MIRLPMRRRSVCPPLAEDAFRRAGMRWAARTRNHERTPTVMKAFASATLAVTVILAILPVGRAAADDSLLIWSPARVSSQAYRLRMGAKAPTAGEMSAGVDLSVTTSATGRIRDTRDNARLWAEMRGQGRSGAERSIAAGYNPLTGRVSASANVSRRWMASRSIDVVLAPTVSADATTRRGHRGTVRLVNRAQIQALPTGTTLVATGAATNEDRRIATEFGLEQRIFEGLDLGASVRRQNAVLVGAVRARLHFDW